MVYEHDNEDEMYQAMREREQRLEEALHRVECHTHTADDVEIIRLECGLARHKEPCDSTNVLSDLFADFGNVFRSVK